MKKLLCAFMCILFLSGCGSVKTKENINEIPDFYGFVTNFKANVNDVEISGRAEYMAFQKLTLTFTSPETLKDMKINVKDGNCEITLQELSFSVPNDKLPFNALSVSILSCGDNVKGATVENNKYTFMSSGNKCELFVNEKTKAFEKLTVNGAELVTFQNFTYYMGQTQ